MLEIYAAVEAADIIVTWDKKNSVRVEYNGRTTTLGLGDSLTIKGAAVVKVPASKKVHATVAAVVALGGFA